MTGQLFTFQLLGFILHIATITPTKVFLYFYLFPPLVLAKCSGRHLLSSFGGSLLVPLQLSGNQKIPETFVYKASGS